MFKLLTEYEDSVPHTPAGRKIIQSVMGICQSTEGNVSFFACLFLAHQPSAMSCLLPYIPKIPNIDDSRIKIVFNDCAQWLFGLRRFNDIKTVYEYYYTKICHHDTQMAYNYGAALLRCGQYNGAERILSTITVEGGFDSFWNSAVIINERATHLCNVEKRYQEAFSLLNNKLCTLSPSTSYLSHNTHES